MAQAIRRSPLHLAVRKSLRRIRGGWHNFTDGLIPRTGEDWAAFVGLALCYAFFMAVAAAWWGGA